MRLMQDRTMERPCTNLRHRKVRWKNISGIYIGIPGRCGHVGAINLRHRKEAQILFRPPPYLIAICYRLGVQLVPQGQAKATAPI